MGKINEVEIGGHFYRYQYVETSGKTEYLGPVGSAPAIGEQEFFKTLAGGLIDTEKPDHEEKDPMISVKHWYFPNGYGVSVASNMFTHNVPEVVPIQWIGEPDDTGRRDTKVIGDPMSFYPEEKQEMERYMETIAIRYG